MLVSTIQEPALVLTSGATYTLRVSPLRLASGRLLADYSGFVLTVRTDPLWPRSGASLYAKPQADPIADAWPVAVQVSGALVNSVPTFTFTMPSAAGIELYALDVWAGLSGGGSVPLVNSRWVTALGRVTAAVGPTVPVNTVPPSITGPAQEGQTLTGAIGTWTGAVTFAYQWLRGGAAIAGADELTYVPQAADVGQLLAFQVTATNAGGSTPATSAAVGPVTASTSFTPSLRYTDPRNSQYIGAGF